MVIEQVLHLFASRTLSKVLEAFKRAVFAPKNDSIHELVGVNALPYAILDVLHP
jgi:hypothetical protein